MIGVRRGLVACVLVLVALLAVLGVGPAGWAVGLACAAVLAVATARRAAVDGVGPVRAG